MKRSVWCCCYQYAARLSQFVNGGHVSALCQGAVLHPLPPVEEEIVDDETKPWRQLHPLLSRICLPHDLLQLLPVHVLHVRYLLRIRLYVYVSHQKQQVVHCQTRNNSINDYNNIQYVFNQEGCIRSSQKYNVCDSVYICIWIRVTQDITSSCKKLIHEMRALTCVLAVVLDLQYDVTSRESTPLRNKK